MSNGSPSHDPTKDILYPDQINPREHDPILPKTKRVSIYGWDADGNQKVVVAVDEDGNLQIGGDIEADLDELEELSGKTLIQAYGSASVPSSTESSLATTTIATGKKLRIKGIYGEGGTDGMFKLYVNSVQVWQGRNAWTTRNVNASMEYEGGASEVVELKVENLKGSTHTFTGGFFGYEL